MSGIIGKRESRGSGIVAGQVPANADIDHDALANFAAGEHFTQANITTIGTVTTGTISTGAVIDDPTMTQGSDATGDVYYRAASGKLTRLATGADGTVLTSTGAGAVPAFEALIGEGISTAWATFTADGTRLDSFNVSGVSQDSTGVYTVTTTISDVSTVCRVASAGESHLNVELDNIPTSGTTIQLAVKSIKMGSGDSTLYVDPEICCVIFFGD